MDFVTESIRWLHVVAGFVGLAAFWVPVLSRKGGVNHVRFGRIFEWCGYIVLLAAGINVSVAIVGGLIKGVSISSSGFAFAVFLGYLAFVTFVILRHGVGVLRTKRDPAQLNTLLNRCLAYGSIAASVALIAYAVSVRPDNFIILLALSPIGLGARSIVRYLKGVGLSRREWMYEHIGAMLGAGIAFHTAFAVFGSARLIEMPFDGWARVLPWVLPAAIGIPASILWTRHYRQRFGDLAT